MDIFNTWKQRNRIKVFPPLLPCDSCDRLSLNFYRYKCWVDKYQCCPLDLTPLDTFQTETTKTSSFQSHQSFNRDFTHGCTRKFTVHIYVYSYSYSPHHGKLQTPFMEKLMEFSENFRRSRQLCTKSDVWGVTYVLHSVKISLLGEFSSASWHASVCSFVTCCSLSGDCIEEEKETNNWYYKKRQVTVFFLIFFYYYYFVWKLKAPDIIGYFLK